MTNQPNPPTQPTPAQLAQLARRLVDANPDVAAEFARLLEREVARRRRGPGLVIWYNETSGRIEMSSRK